MNVIEKTRELCKVMQEDEVYKEFAAAKLQNDNDEQLQSDIGRFNLARMGLDKELSSEDKNEEKVNAYNEELREIYGKIMTNPSMIAYNEAKAKLDEMLNNVNNLILMCLNGADPDTAEPAANCGGNCSSCGGCH